MRSLKSRLTAVFFGLCLLATPGVVYAQQGSSHSSSNGGFFEYVLPILAMLICGGGAANGKK